MALQTRGRAGGSERAIVGSQVGLRVDRVLDPPASDLQRAHRPFPPLPPPTGRPAPLPSSPHPADFATGDEEIRQALSGGRNRSRSRSQTPASVQPQDREAPIPDPSISECPPLARALWAQGCRMPRGMSMSMQTADAVPPAAGEHASCCSRLIARQVWRKGPAAPAQAVWRHLPTPRQTSSAVGRVSSDGVGLQGGYDTCHG